MHVQRHSLGAILALSAIWKLPPELRRSILSSRSRLARDGVLGCGFYGPFYPSRDHTVLFRHVFRYLVCAGDLSPWQFDDRRRCGDAGSHGDGTSTTNSAGIGRRVRAKFRSLACGTEYRHPPDPSLAHEPLPRHHRAFAGVQPIRLGADRGSCRRCWSASTLQRRVQIP
jgi:hypothetical protein